ATLASHSDKHNNIYIKKLRLVPARLALSRQSRNQKVLRRRVPVVAMVSSLTHSPARRRNVMHSFVSKFAAVVRGVLNGFDRLFFCGTLRNLAHRRGLQHYRWAHRIPYKDFAAD